MILESARSIRGLLVLGALTLGTIQTTAWASDPQAGHGDTGHAAAQPNILSGDLGNVFWTATIFITLLIVLRVVAWKPILSALQGREKFITDSIADAKRDREEAKRILADYSAKIEKARLDATAIIDEGRRDAEALKRKLHDETNHEVQEMLARARRDIKIAQDAAVKELSDRTLDLAASVASKIIRKQTTAADHRTLLDESIAELGRMNN